MNKVKNEILPVISSGEIDMARKDPLDETTIEQARTIISNVKKHKDYALRRYAVTFGDRKEDEPLVLNRVEMEKVLNNISTNERELLERVAKRIREFSQKQLACVQELSTTVVSGTAGHLNIPVERAGCYAPGGRFPLPSSVLMTVIPAKVAGVKSVWVASPNPNDIMIAAAAIAGADNFLTVGGAQAIGAFAFGTESIPPCDLIVGPGNRWVTAAKMLVAGRVNIDMLAGPSELVVLADKSANPKIIALDLLAQAEHDVDALPILLASDASIIENVRCEIISLLKNDPTETAELSLRRGFAIVLKDLDEAVCLVNKLAPEHIQLSVAEPQLIITKLNNYGALFIGEMSAEVFGDYGVGPNHVLPTSRGACKNSGLSVTTFMRQPTWLKLKSSNDLENIIEDTMRLAEIEGLKWHAKAAEARMNKLQ